MHPILPLRWTRWVLVLSCLVLLRAATAGASMLETVIMPFTGDDTAVRLVLAEDAGDIVFSVSVEEGRGDLRGVFFDLSDDTLLAALQVSGTDVAGFETGAVTDLGHGANLNGGGSPCPCDVGVMLGSPGIGRDDLMSASFVVSHETLDLDLSQFFGEVVGVRVTSVGPFSGPRTGSAKLGGILPVPEPATGLMLGCGLAAFGLARRRLPS